MANNLLRFSLYHRCTHFLLIISFFGLVLTGMPLVFKDYGWSLYLYNKLGGYPTAGYIHRICALITFFVAFLHFAFLSFEAVMKKNGRLFWGPDSLIIQPRDILNIIGDILWFFRLGPRPKFDRWIYWEKFEYLSLIWGTLVMGVTGFILWFPVQSVNIMPAGLVNIVDLPSIALIAHRYEAILAAGFIFTIHFFHTHLLPEKLPVDEAMFTGKVLEEEVLHERGSYYERLKKEEQLEESKINPPSARASFVSKLFGIPILVIGLLMVSFMLSSLICSLI
ncbi:MAG: formate dehydrogenase subunit gamma [Candidatus Scalinduaceae bacterium]